MDLNDKNYEKNNSLNILSLNVHAWLSPDSKQKIDESVCDLVEKHNPDVCGFQEVMRPLEKLHAIADVLNVQEENVHFTATSIFGNAVIFKPNGQVVDMKLRVTGREQRCATKVLVETGHNWDLAVINLHLDHQLESVRIKQMKIVLEWLNNGDNIVSYLPHVIMGDFNAVSHWTPKVSAMRLKHNLQPSTDELYRLLTETYKYIDLESKHPPQNTSVYNVRVDYILCSAALVPRILRGETKFQTIKSPSDHSAVQANIIFNLSKIMIGIKSTQEEKIGSGIRESLLKADLGGKIEIIEGDFSHVFDVLQMADTVIVESDDVMTLSPSLDLLFHVESENNKLQLNETNKKIVTVSSLAEIQKCIFDFFENLLS